MADEDKKVDPKEGKSTETAPPSSPQDGEGKKTEEEPAVPKQFEGKTAQDIAKSYSELQKLHGAQAKELGDYRENNSRWEALAKIIEGNPAIYKAIETEIDQATGKGNTNNEPKKKDDTRVAVENKIVGDFEQQYGINTLETDKRKELHIKIGNEIKEMFDPSGTKNLSQVMDEIPLNTLPRYLDKAYRLAIADDTVERARVEGLLQARQNREATVGSIPSSGVNSETTELTPKQREVARRMNISEEDYRKQLEEMAKEEIQI